MKGGALRIRPGLWPLLGLCLTIGACGGKRDIDAPPPIPSTYSYNYSLSSSATFMPNGASAMFVSAPTSVECFVIGTPVVHDNAPFPIASNSATINFSKLRSDWFWWSIYIDIDANGVLSNGDQVWGSNPAQIFGLCAEPLGNVTDNAAKDWASFGSLKAGGVTTFTGPTQSF